MFVKFLLLSSPISTVPLVRHVELLKPQGMVASFIHGDDPIFQRWSSVARQGGGWWRVIHVEHPHIPLLPWRIVGRTLGHILWEVGSYHYHCHQLFQLLLFDELYFKKIIISQRCDSKGFWRFFLENFTNKYHFSSSLIWNFWLLHLLTICFFFLN